ncbi:MAG: hypothetical protein ACOCUL_03360, partial [Bacteroidota bacterium]
IFNCKSHRLTHKPKFAKECNFCQHSKVHRMAEGQIENSNLPIEVKDGIIKFNRQRKSWNDQPTKARVWLPFPATVLRSHTHAFFADAHLVSLYYGCTYTRTEKEKYASD